METESIPPSDTLSLLWNIGFHQFTIETGISILILIVLLFASALISGSEVAFFSLSPANQEELKDTRRKSNNIIRELLNVPEKLLATILVANNFINVGIVVLSAYITHSLVNFTNAPLLGFVAEIVLITFILLLFGEILPKIYASNDALSFAQFMARPLIILSKLFSPLSSVLVKSTSIVNRRLTKKNKNISINDLSQALELTSDEDISEDKGILEGIVKFGTTSVDQIMTPRIDVVAIDFNNSFSKVIDTIRNSGYSRIPVYKESFDEVVGILYGKDLLVHLKNDDDYNWQNLVRDTYYVPENKKIDDLLKEFQREKVHMAIVVDEYGGTSGIVSLEDILEEIVGDIIDEFDDEDRLYTKVNDTTYLFDGKTQLNDFYRICGIDEKTFEDEKGEADTLAGLLLEMKGDFPTLGEKLVVRNIDFFVDQMDKRRIKKIKVVFNNTIA